VASDVTAVIEKSYSPIQANVKVTAKRLDYYVEITNRERSFGSNRWVKVGRGQL